MKYWTTSGGKMTKPEKKVIVWAIIGGLAVFFISKNRLNEYNDSRNEYYEANGL